MLKVGALRKYEKDNEGRLEDTRGHADDDQSNEDDEQDHHIPKFPMKKLIIAIDSLKTGKSADRKGIKAEDPKELTKKGQI